jgi:hypothetical protein
MERRSPRRIVRRRVRACGRRGRRSRSRRRSHASASDTPSSQCRWSACPRSGVVLRHGRKRNLVPGARSSGNGPLPCEARKSHDTDLLRGALFIVASELMFASMGATIKAAALSGMPNEMLIFLRNLVGMLLICPLLLHRGGPANLRTRRNSLNVSGPCLAAAKLQSIAWSGKSVTQSPHPLIPASL